MSKRSNPAVSVCGRRLVLLLAVTAGLGGCGPPNKVNDSVTGKVTLKGQPVAGEVIFVGSDRKEVGSPIGADGSYQIYNPPKGEVQILVKGFPGAAVEPPKDAPPRPGAGGAAPPARYARPNNGLTMTVTGGKQTHDVPLTP
jgi:hypothetical protein